MQPRTVWIMLVLVVLLGGVALWQQDREKQGLYQADRMLFEDARAERIRSVRVDHLERGLQMRIERGEDGAWQITDPLVYPAEAGVMERLLEVVTKNRANVIAGADPKTLGLSPPRAVLEIVESLPSGERTLRLELGLQDLDRKHVYARIDGQVVRTLMNLDSTLERDLPDWRRRRISELDPASVVEFQRIGKLALDPAAGLVDLALAAGTTDAGWQASVPWNARLDPAHVQMFLSNVCYLQARTFVADSALQMQALGMENPDLRIAMTSAAGKTENLLFRRADQASWLCMHEGSTHVYRVDDVNLVFLSLPSDGLLDRQLARVPREAVQRIALERDGEKVELWRDGAHWKLARMEGDSPKEELRADPQVVLDLQAKLEGALAVRFLLDGEIAGFVPTTPPTGWRVFTRDAEHGADFGGPFELAPGVEGRLFRRAGEELFGVVEPSVAELANWPFAELVERQMIRLPEAGITRIELSRGATWKRTYLRDASTGRWALEGASVEAPKSFLKALERLLSLRADVAVSPEQPFELVDPWHVVVIDGGAVRYGYRVGPLASDPEAAGFDDGGQRGVITSSGLVRDLAEIP